MLFKLSIQNSDFEPALMNSALYAYVIVECLSYVNCLSITRNETKADKALIKFLPVTSKTVIKKTGKGRKGYFAEHRMTLKFGD